jgi:hypothetical protein
MNMTQEKTIAKTGIPAKLLQPVETGTPTIEISRSVGFTVNLQGYESARIDSTVKITGALENKDEITALVSAELESQITAQIQDIVAQHNPNKTLLGYNK